MNIKLWTVKAGRFGEQEQICLEKNLITIGWNALPNLKEFKSREELFKKFQEIYQENNRKTGNKSGQIWSFTHGIAIGDIVALPSKMQPVIHIGRVIGDYCYEKKSDNVQHWRSVKWLDAIPRVEFDQDILYSFGALQTISQVARDNAAERVLSLIETDKSAKGLKSTIIKDDENFGIDRFAKDKITKFIDRRFQGHNLANIINEILHAQGYITHISKPGPDGGVDILASKGALGFEQPSICVQVKFGKSQMGVEDVDRLMGVMNKFKSTFGLFVSWGGYKSKILTDSKKEFFHLRLWTADDVIENIFKYYDMFSEDFKAEFPLKRIWVLVEEEDDLI